jgi:hypothetical protein
MLRLNEGNEDNGTAKENIVKRIYDNCYISFANCSGGVRKK